MTGKPASRRDRVPVAEPAVPWLHLLGPTPAGRMLVPASSGAHFSRAVRTVGAEAAQWAVETGQSAAQRVATEIPGHVTEGGFDVLRMGTESTVIQLLIALAGVETETPVTPESLGGIPDFVRGRVSLDEVLRGIQLGHSVIAGSFLAECALLGNLDKQQEQMRILSHQMFSFFDAFSTHMAAAYREEEVRWAQSDAASQLALVEEILKGHEQSRETTSRRLRYDLDRTHVALFVWSSGRTLDADQDALYEAASGLLRQVGCEQKLVLSVNLGLVWAWATPRGAANELTERLAVAALPGDTHAAFGFPSTGLTGFRESHGDAQAAFTLRSQSPSTPSVTPYRDVDLLSLVLSDRERALRFARRELGALAASESHIADLRRTLATYLEEGGSPRGAAERLSISRNTVTYRVRRAVELLGRDLGERRQHLQAALAIFEECVR